MRADELFVFSGAGLSLPPPTGLPIFWQIREELLRQLGLAEYIAPAGIATVDQDQRRVPSARERLAAGLLPEPFLESLTSAGILANEWLDGVLGVGEVNAGHRCIAELISRGAFAWTVNFDTGIEKAAGGLRVHDLDQQPPTADLRKPHGTVGGKKLFQASDVLAGLSPLWEGLLRDEIKNRTVVLVGYSGNDLDFRPIWDDVLLSAQKVIWFCMNAKEAEFKRALLPQTSKAGRLFTPTPQHHPILPNSTLEFGRWCRSERLVTCSAADIETLGNLPTVLKFPQLIGPNKLAAAVVEASLGDHRSAKKHYLAAIWQGPDLAYPTSPDRKKMARGLINLTANFGGWPTAIILSAGSAVLGHVPALDGMREFFERKRLNNFQNVGRGDLALKVIADYGVPSGPAIDTVKAGALKYFGSLRDAASLADATLRAELTANKPNAVVVSNAAMQLVLALLWGGHVDAAREAYSRTFTEYAPVSASRWIGWSPFLKGSIVVHSQDKAAVIQVLPELDEAIELFDASRLFDGIASTLLIKLAGHRLLKDEAWWKQDRRRLQRLMTNPASDGSFYIHHSANLAASVALEDAQWTQFHSGKPHALASASRLYRDAERYGRRSALLAAQARLGLHATLNDSDQQRIALEQARSSAKAAAAENLLTEVERRGGGQEPNELFVP